LALSHVPLALMVNVVLLFAEVTVMAIKTAVMQENANLASTENATHCNAEATVKWILIVTVLLVDVVLVSMENAVNVDAEVHVKRTHNVLIPKVSVVYVKKVHVPQLFLQINAI